MNGLETIGRWLVIGGLALAVAGGVIWLLARLVNLDDLPGTIRIQGSGVTCIFPILASIMLSLVLTLVLNLLARYFNK